ncbi:hypothetical protein SAMN05428952_100228 [Nitrosomonas sp. Nm132]|jgi:TRAP-type mannitol/chloroaromatic compound transport system permease large subunit|nr:hypothetical protein SAMN05428952_100228 [Nitrosomonas sp. Nm132]
MQELERQLFAGPLLIKCSVLVWHTCRMNLQASFLMLPLGSAVFYWRDVMLLIFFSY